MPKAKAYPQTVDQLDKLLDKVQRQLDENDEWFEENLSSEKLILHYRAHYHCAILNWRLLLREAIDLRARVHELENK